MDFYSVGPDGIDDQGMLDDVSSWEGVNDGFHWKRNWPKGRLAIVVGVALGLVCLVSIGPLISWRIAFPTAGCVVCSCAVLGCHWLKHPGVVSYRNSPLSIAMLLATVGLLFALYCLFKCLRYQAKHRLTKALIKR